jgi:hypothetical protein
MERDKMLTVAFFIFSVESFYLNIISDLPEVCFEVTAVRSRVQFPMVSLEFFINTILPAALWPWG